MALRNQVHRALRRQYDRPIGEGQRQLRRWLGTGCADIGRAAAAQGRAIDDAVHTLVNPVEGFTLHIHYRAATGITALHCRLSTAVGLDGEDGTVVACTVVEAIRHIQVDLKGINSATDGLRVAASQGSAPQLPAAVRPVEFVAWGIDRQAGDADQVADQHDLATAVAVNAFDGVAGGRSTMRKVELTAGRVEGQIGGIGRDRVGVDRPGAAAIQVDLANVARRRCPDWPGGQVDFAAR